jgi:hypothetical protein
LSSVWVQFSILSEGPVLGSVGWDTTLNLLEPGPNPEPNMQKGAKLGSPHLSLEIRRRAVILKEIKSTRAGEERDGGHNPKSSQAWEWERQGMVAATLKDHKHESRRFVEIRLEAAAS